jgi:hypothetical protein
MPTSKAQEWAQKRNRTKGRLKGMVVQLKNMKILTKVEKHQVQEALNTLESLLYFWDETNPESKKQWLGEDKK